MIPALNAYDRLDRLAGVDPRLSAILILAATRFYVHNKRATKVRFTSGVRTHAEQRDLVNAGKSWTMNSYHLWGKAVDVAIFVRKDNASEITWEMPWYEAFNREVQNSSDTLSQVVTWGGDWSQRDGVHFQLETVDRPPREG